MPTNEHGKFIPPRRLFHPHIPHFRHGDLSEHDKTIAEAKKAHKIFLTPAEAHMNQARIHEAQEILAQDFLGPEAVRATFGIELLPQEIPHLNTDPTMLRNARSEGLTLILRINKSADGSPLTISQMGEVLEPVFSAFSEGRVLYPTSIYPKRDFFTKDLPRTGWFFVSKEPVQGTDHKTYLAQSHVLGDYLLGSDVFNQKHNLEHSIRYLNLQDKELQALAVRDPQQAVVVLSYLVLNRSARQTPVEAVYDLLMYFQHTGKRLLPEKSSLTGGRNSFSYDRNNFIINNRFIGVGNFGAEGIRITEHAGNESSSKLGANVSFAL